MNLRHLFGDDCIKDVNSEVSIKKKFLCVPHCAFAFKSHLCIENLARKSKELSAYLYNKTIKIFKE